MMLTISPGGRGNRDVSYSLGRHNNCQSCVFLRKIFLHLSRFISKEDLSRRVRRLPNGPAKSYFRGRFSNDETSGIVAKDIDSSRDAFIYNWYVPPEESTLSVASIDWMIITVSARCVCRRIKEAERLLSISFRWIWACLMFIIFYKSIQRAFNQEPLSHLFFEIRHSKKIKPIPNAFVTVWVVISTTRWMQTSNTKAATPELENEIIKINQTKFSIIIILIRSEKDVNKTPPAKWAK